jgi:predicted nicotinamide N-methyase
MELVEKTVRVGDVELALLRPPDPEALLDETRFAQDEFLPYWAELWPAGLALARALPHRLDGVRVVELGCGLGVPSLVAASRGAQVTATDWADEAIELLRANAARNGVDVDAHAADWRAFEGRFDLALAADVLYEPASVEPLLSLLPRIAPRILLADPRRPAADDFLGRARRRWKIETKTRGVVSIHSLR